MQKRMNGIGNMAKIIGFQVYETGNASKWKRNRNDWIQVHCATSSPMNCWVFIYLFVLLGYI